MVDREENERLSSGPCANECYRSAIRRFDRPENARNYPPRYRNNWRDRRELRNIRCALRHVSPGSQILDLACGTGRLLDVLLENGHRVTCADVSEHMVRVARGRWEEIRGERVRTTQEPSFCVRDVMQTGFADGQFDAVVCNRLFHHLWETDVRIRALTELARISRGPVIVSFFNAFSLGNVRFRLKHALVRGLPRDRMPIPAWAFLNDLRRAGLTPVSMYGVLRGISPLYHVVGIPMPKGANALFGPRPTISKTALLDP